MNQRLSPPEAAEADTARALEETQRTLKARALALAQAPLPAGEEGQGILQVIEFLLSKERFAVESGLVREVAVLENLAPLPCTPAFVLGVVNLRGEILPVIDLRRFFDMPEQGLADLDRIIVLQSKTTTFGIRADAIVGLRRVPAAAIHAPPPTLTGMHRDYLTGVAPGPLAILDAVRLMHDPRIVVEEHVDE